MESLIRWKRGDYIRLGRAISKFNQTMSVGYAILAERARCYVHFRLVSFHFPTNLQGISFVAPYVGIRSLIHLPYPLLEAHRNLHTQ